MSTAHVFMALMTMYLVYAIASAQDSGTVIVYGDVISMIAIVSHVIPELFFIH